MMEAAGDGGLHRRKRIGVDTAAADVAAALAAIETARRARAQGDLDELAAAGRPSADVTTQVRYYTDLLELADCDPRGLRALDAGCGFGFGLVVLAALDAASVTGFELLPERVETTRAYLADLPPAMRERIEVVQGDALQMPCADGSFDVVVSNEVSKSLLDLAGFCAEAARVLAPGGVLVVADRNTMCNRRLRRRTLDLWEAYEEGPAGAVVHGHRIDDPYALQRERIIRARFGDMPDERARALAQGTFGMTEEQAVAACQAHLAGGPAPSSRRRRGVLPVDPAGMVPEALVDPRALARYLASHGLQTHVYGYWGGASGRRAVRAADRVMRALTPLTITAAPAFRVIARKS